MNPLVTVVSILLSLFAPRPASAVDVDEVVRKAAIYERGFESAVMDLVAVEQYEQKTSRAASLYAGANSTLFRSGTVERHVNADIVMFQDGNLRYPVRCVRNQDGLGAEAPDYSHKEAIAALGNRPDAKAFRRTFNLPIVPLMTLHPANLARGKLVRRK